ncbi:hypothetical protein SAMN05720761_1167 [Fibrobacter sp. UWCM]|uniref:hypothetical protein n=1 Tax=Fibrobacter sp. UWCM TaxID=1896208 RepID=UPI00091376EA|nr:hypothetical protein [Fibrobacter sp. UWCM]SHH48099.1 hypothetical protein SAMN05720761_1167 [Fibrobacter sp. UWCM]
MGGVLLGLLIFACAVALVVLFFPIRFRIDFGADENGGGAKFYIYKKNFYTWEKFRKGKSHGSDESLDDDEFAGKLHDDSTDKSREDSSSESHDEDSAVPEFVATAPAKPVEKKTAPSASSAGSLTGSGTSSPIEVKADAQEKTAPVEVAKDAAPVETAKEAVQEKTAPVETSPKADDAQPAEVKQPAKVETPAASAESAQPAESKKTAAPAGDKKNEKRDLTDFEFWTLVLTPDLDERGFRYVKRLLVDLVRLFNVKFENCFVEGIRADYKTMGYGAALNGVIKGFPFLRDWDLRMDWCNEKDLRVQGNILARTNLCRVLFYLLELALLAGIVFLIFWRRRARVLKTGELPELGFVRQKIRAFFVED